jgi:hypothetical protein
MKNSESEDQLTLRIGQERLFILGSFQFLIRPSIRLVRHIHLRKEPRDGWDC